MAPNRRSLEPSAREVTLPGTGGRWRRVFRTAGVVLALLVLVAAAGGLWLRSRLVASLPQLEGERPLPGLAAAVTVERDGLGVPTIRGANRLDVARALGFVHAQDRFFHMDLLRRSAAGELAEVVGPPVVKADREIRVHRLRDVARRVVERASAGERAVVDAYTEGVNAGLGALGSKPFEYLLLRAEPAAWRAEDTVLVVLAMFVRLQDEKGRRESDLGVVADVLPPPLFEFLAPRGTEWDAPVAGEPFSQPKVPGAEVFDLRTQPELPKVAAAAPLEPEPVLGSNNWAVAGSRTADGRAILANDMHLGIAVPNTWYRASLVWSEGGEERRITGVTLPGTPVVIVGSNGHVAWGFTNSYGDFGDLVVVETDPKDKNSYRTPDGPRRIERVTERIRVKGATDETLVVEQTIWGPVVDHDHRGRPRAMRWVAQDPDAVNMGHFRLESARSLDEALTLANQSGIPAQNFVCADASGRIGWTIIGIIPRRVGFDGRLPGSWADGTRRWDGWLEPEEHPRIVDPPGGLLWTANARVVDGEMLAKLGDGGYDLGARARQIRDDLRELGKATERDMLRVQLDDRALFLARWRDLLLRTLTPEAAAKDARRAEFRKHVEAWGGRAAVASVGYRLVRGFRLFLMDQVMEALTASCKKADSRFVYQRIPQLEGPLWALVSERPAHLLDPRFKTWDDQLLAAVDSTIDYMLKIGGPLGQRTWGERNSPSFPHPLSRAVPLLSRFLDMPAQPMPGDANMPRVQDGEEGASERLAVSPGREADGYFHMPCGQSGHPLSPHYADSQPAWLKGEPTPFLPGPPAHTLRFLPGSGGERRP